MKFLFPFLIFFCVFASQSFIAQENKKIDVNKDISITKVYEQVIKEGYGTPKVYLDLANAYYFEGNYAKAKKWYEKVFEIENTASEKTLFRYTQSLKALNEDFINNEYIISLSTN
ncbi:MAG: tetratricopeptide repeat protein [Flavobacteriaceae bacterium]